MYPLINEVLTGHTHSYTHTHTHTYMNTHTRVRTHTHARTPPTVCWLLMGRLPECRVQVKVKVKYLGVERGVITGWTAAEGST